MVKELKLAIVDVETTGASVTGDPVIEIGVKRIEQGRVVQTFESLVDPEQRIPPFIEQLTGIRNADLEGAPPFGAIRPELEAILSGCVFVAHNVRFDYGLIRNEFARLGHAFSAPCLCSVRLSRRLYPRYRHHGLSELIERFHLSCPQRHRALGDVEAVWAFLQVAYQDQGAERFEAAVKTLLRTPTLPPQLPAEALQQLSDGPGVYIFYDNTGQPLYVGKSRSIRSRVLSHFSGDYYSGRTMRLCQQATRIESHPTFGELGALLLESHLIKTLAPLYNQPARAHRELVIARRLRTWPYEGPVMLEEANGDRSEGHVFVVDSWRLIQSFQYDEAGTRPFLPAQTGFDHDAYKILVAHLLRHPRAVKPWRADRPMPDADTASQQRPISVC